MKLTFRKREVKDVSELERLVSENADAIEPGFRVVAANLHLGRSSVALAGVDANGRPALVSVGLSADDATIFQMVEAYAWCVEYPESILRLAPAATAAGDWQPRVVFVADRMLESFLRKVRLLKFPRVDCLEYRYVEVNGALGFYLDAVDWNRDAAAPPTFRGAAPPSPVPMATADHNAPAEAPRPSTPAVPAYVLVEGAADEPTEQTEGATPEPERLEPPRMQAPILSDLGGSRELTPTWRGFLDKLTGGFEPRPATPLDEPMSPAHFGATRESEPWPSTEGPGEGAGPRDPDAFATLASPETGAEPSRLDDPSPEAEAEDDYYDKQRQLLEGLKLPSNGELAPQWRKFLDEPSTPDERKSAVMREYLQREFPMSVVYGFHDFQRNALVFQLQDNQGKVMQLATLTAEFLDDCTESELRTWIENHRLSQALRQAGQAGVLVTRAGLLIDHR